MVRVLFVCWGNIRRISEKANDFGTLRDVQKRIQTTFRPFKKQLKMKILSGSRVRRNYYVDNYTIGDCS